MSSAPVNALIQRTPYSDWAVLLVRFIFVVNIETCNEEAVVTALQKVSFTVRICRLLMLGFQCCCVSTKLIMSFGNPVPDDGSSATTTMTTWGISEPVMRFAKLCKIS